MKKNVDILVFSYNNENVIGACLDSISRQTYKNFTCTLVDDCSTDNTVSIARKKYPWVRVIEKSSNTGPSASRNIGIGKTRNELIVMLDSDVVLERDWSASQVAVMERHDAAVVGSKLLFASNPEKINSAGGCLTRLGFGFDRGRGKGREYYNKIEQIMYACSAAWIMRRSVIEKIGLFDDTYFYPHEDTDFCWRANLAGFHVIYNPDAVAYHRVGDSTKKMSDKVAFHVTKNRIRSMLKNYESKNIIKYLPLHLFLIGANIVVAGKGISKIKGLLWNIKNIEDTLNERNAVRKTRKRSDKELKSLFAGKII